MVCVFLMWRHNRMEIILVRHGKPLQTIRSRLTADNFVSWVKCYDQSKVDLDNSPPPKALVELSKKSFILSSSLPRAVHSAEIVNDQSPHSQLALLNEMQIPQHQLFSRIKLSISSWLFINRVLWLLGFTGNVESFKQANIRAKEAALELVNLSGNHESIVAFGHGLMNRQVNKELIKLGWQSNIEGREYWSRITLIKNN